MFGSCMWSVIGVGCVMVLGVGCHESGLKNHDEHTNKTSFYDQITTFEGLDGQLVFSDPEVQRGVYQPIHVAIPVRAAGDQAQRVQYRFEYFDRAGRPMRPSMDWRYILLPVQGERVMDGSALDSAAVDWRLEIRRARRR